MSDDTISRQAAIDRATKDHDFYKGATTPTNKARRDELLNVMCWLNELPSAERRGRWEFNIDDNRWSWDNPYMCDQCGEWAEKAFKFCPNCGARMEDAEE